MRNQSAGKRQRIRFSGRDSVKIMALLLAFLVLMMTGCSGSKKAEIRIVAPLSDSELFKIGDEVCSVSEAMILVTAQKKVVEDVYGEEIWSVKSDGLTFEENVKSSLKDFLARMKCMTLMAADNDVTLEDIARLCDVFYIGGTKVGALFGEAVVITNPAISKDFRYMIKQRGGMLAKGRLLGIQFQTLFEDGLYWQISRHAIDMAMKLKKAFQACGYGFYVENSTNQQLPVLPDAVLEKLAGKYSYSFWEKTDESHSAVRFCTSWATKEENVDALIADLNQIRLQMM